jgi:hypothetical protein
MALFCVQLLDLPAWLPQGCSYALHCQEHFF